VPSEVETPPAMTGTTATGTNVHARAGSHTGTAKSARHATAAARRAHRTTAAVHHTARRARHNGASHGR
jgi:hypothetical protein